MVTDHVSYHNDDSSYEEAFSLTVKEIEHGLRLDLFLTGHLAEASRSQIVSSIKKGSVQLNGGVEKKASRKLHTGDVVQGKLAPIKQSSPLLPQKIDFQILYEDEWIIGISKPPQLVVHPGDGNPDKTLVNGLLYHCDKFSGVGESLRPGIVHRLDKDTSGVMVVAKEERSHRLLVESFKSREVSKCYHAIVIGCPSVNSGRIVAPIGRHPTQRKKMAINNEHGKHAASQWQLVEKLKDNHSYFKIHIETGRTHQIRVHLAAIGHPIAGDLLYGPKKTKLQFPRQMLHSSLLKFNHPVSKEEVTLEAPLWKDFLDVYKRLSDVGE